MGLEFLFLTQVCVGIVMVILLLKISQLKTQVDYITKEVGDYISFLTEDVKEEVSSTERKPSKKGKFAQMDESQSRLIQAVLKEFFP